MTNLGETPFCLFGLTGDGDVPPLSQSTQHFFLQLGHQCQTLLGR